jgi:hypothetical protein
VAGKIVHNISHNIDTEPTNFRMNFAPQANFLQVNKQKKDRKNEIGDLGAPKSWGPWQLPKLPYLNPALVLPIVTVLQKKNLQNQRQLGQHDFCPFCHNSEFCCQKTSTLKIGG